MTISKELFEAVMNIEPRGNTFRVESKGMYYAKNYYTYNDFFFMCKEWAYENDYDIWSITWGAVEFQCNEKYNGTKRINADSEHQAVFDACQWILENKGKNESI